MVKRFLLESAGRLLLAGVVLLGLMTHTIYQASTGGKIPPEAQLTTQSGTITGGRKVTVERHGHNGRRYIDKYYELDLTTSASLVKLRMDFTVPRKVLEASMDREVAVKYDANGSNTVYAIERAGENVLSYADMAAISQREADAEKSRFVTPGMIALTAMLLLVGGRGMYLRHKSKAANTED